MSPCPWCDKSAEHVSVNVAFHEHRFPVGVTTGPGSLL